MNRSQTVVGIKFERNSNNPTDNIKAPAEVSEQKGTISPSNVRYVATNEIKNIDKAAFIATGCSVGGMVINI